MVRVVLDRTVHVTPYGSDEVFVRRGSRSTFSKVIRDEGRRGVLRHVIQALVEPRERDEVIAEIAGVEQEGEAHGVEQVLDLLLRHEVVHEVGASLDEDGHVGHVRVIGTGRLAQDLAALLEEEGVSVGVTMLDAGTGDDEERLAETLEGDEDARCAVLALDHLRPAISYAANEAAMMRGLPVLHVVLDGSEVVVGPFVVPGETACYMCHDVGEEGTRQFRHDFVAYKDALDREPRTGPISPLASKLAAAWAVLAVRSALTSDRSYLHGRLLRIDLERVEVVSHRVMQLPRCPACSRARPDLRHAFL